MKDYLKLIFSIIVVGFTATGCVNTIYPFVIPTKSPDIPVNNIEKKIPRYPNGKVFAYYKFTKQKQKQLNLSVPENGHDSLLIRFWFSYPDGIYQNAELVEFDFKSDSIPICRYKKMRIFYNPSRIYEVINYHVDSLINQPLSGWSKFIDTLNYCKISELLTIEDIPSYILLTNDGLDYNNTSMTVSVEVGKKDSYRFYQYNNFEKYKEIDEVGKFYSFIKYIREDFNLQQIDPEWYKE